MSSLKLKTRTLFPALVTALSPLGIVKNGIAYEFSLSINALRASLDPIYAPIEFFSGPVVVTGANAAVAARTRAVAVNRIAPSATGLTLPKVAEQNGMPLSIIDWSTSVTDHTITLTPDAANTGGIMRAATWPIYSNAASLGSLTLYPSTVLNGWYIAP